MNKYEFQKYPPGINRHSKYFFGNFWVDVSCFLILVFLNCIFPNASGLPPTWKTHFFFQELKITTNSSCEELKIFTGNRTCLIFLEGISTFTNLMRRWQNEISEGLEIFLLYFKGWNFSSCFKIAILICSFTAFVPPLFAPFQFLWLKLSKDP